jgi:formate hydrogenlyase subunit 3/multisubunit Na+/H+ antiporter MnhD subunit
MTGPTIHVPWLMLGGRLTLDPPALAFLSSTALVWALAGWAAFLHTRDDPGRRRFLAFFSLTMGSSLLATVAGDPLTFFLAYSVLGLAAYPLIVHRRSLRAVRTARWYLAFMIAGEGALLAAILLASDGHEAVGFPVALTSVVVSVLVLVGLGVKCGVPGLHSWMPATYEVAPWPVAAALAGGTVGVGILGFMRFGLAAPRSAVSPGVWVGIGTAGLALGVVRGLVRREPERILAYSSVSQMGIALAVLGFGAAVSADATRLALAVSAFVAHHALAKASLFLGVGAMRAGTTLRGRRDHPILIAMVALPALALAGAPLSSGALAKGAMSGAVGAAGLDRLLLASSAATTVLMLHFLGTVVRMAREDGPARVGPETVMMPWSSSVAAVALGIWTWPAFRSMAAHLLEPHAILQGTLALLGGAVVWAGLTATGWRGTGRISLADRAARRVAATVDRWVASRREVRPALRHLPAETRRGARRLAARGEAAVATLDRRVGTWTLTGTLFLGLLLVLRILL